MTYTYPLSTTDLMETLGIEKVTWDTERYDEFDSQGSGHDIQSELAPPKWVATLVMRDLYNAEARAMAARVRALHGAENAFMVYDPSNPNPAADPTGTILGAATVQIKSIGADRKSLSLEQLPEDYQVTIGDKGQVVFASGARNYFFEFSETIVADGDGETVECTVYPHIPVGVLVNATVNLLKPACKMIVQPRGFSPGQSSGNMTSGALIRAMEKI